MSDNPIRRLAEAIVAGDTRPKKPSKSNRMLSLSEPQFTRFQKYCHARKVFASEVIDVLIAEFMREVADDVDRVLTEDPADPKDLPAPRRGGR